MLFQKKKKRPYQYSKSNFDNLSLYLRKIILFDDLMFLCNIMLVHSEKIWKTISNSKYLVSFFKSCPPCTHFLLLWMGYLWGEWLNVYMYACCLLVCRIFCFNLLNCGVPFNIALTCNHLIFGCLCVCAWTCLLLYHFSWF